jgi:hypothetical protein
MGANRVTLYRQTKTEHVENTMPRFFHPTTSHTEAGAQIHVGDMS